MKRIIFILALFAILPQFALADDTTVILKPTGPGVGNHPKPKSPTDLSFLPTVTFNDATNVLIFVGNSDLGAVAYYVEDENDMMVAAGTLYIYDSGTSTVNLGTLAVGSYTLYIEVGTDTYAGDFEAD